MKPEQLFTLPASWRFMRGVQRTVRGRPVLLVPVSIGVTIAALVIASVLVLALLAYSRAGVMAAMACLSVLVPMLSLIGTVIRAWSIRLFEMQLRGVEPRLGRAFRQTWSQWPSLLAITAAQLVLRRAAGKMQAGERLRHARSLLARLIVFAGEVAGYLLLPVVVIERRPLADALDRVHDIHRGKYLTISAGDRGLLLAPGLITALAWAASFLVGFGLAKLGVGIAPWILYGGCAAAMVFLQTTTALCRAAYYTCLYMWAVDRERGDRGAPPPDLLARALGTKN